VYHFLLSAYITIPSTTLTEAKNKRTLLKYQKYKEKEGDNTVANKKAKKARHFIQPNSFRKS